MSVMRAPSASLMNSGVPPTALNARTGDDTPPGITSRARRKASSDLAVERGLRSAMGSGDLRTTPSRSQRREEGSPRSHEEHEATPLSSTPHCESSVREHE